MSGVAYIFSIVSTTSVAAFFGASRRRSRDICSQSARILDQFPDFSREQIAGKFRFLQQDGRLGLGKNLRHCAFDDPPPRRETESGSAGNAKAASSARLAAPERAIAKSAAL